MYQKLVNKMSKNLIKKAIEVHIDGMLIKSKKELDHIVNLEEMFNILQMNKMKLNQVKCALSFNLGKFLGYMIN